MRYGILRRGFGSYAEYILYLFYTLLKCIPETINIKGCIPRVIKNVLPTLFINIITNKGIKYNKSKPGIPNKSTILPLKGILYIFLIINLVYSLNNEIGFPSRVKGKEGL